jgi:hypothetical protein
MCVDPQASLESSVSFFHCLKKWQDVAGIPISVILINSLTSGIGIDHVVFGVTVHYCLRFWEGHFVAVSYVVIAKLGLKRRVVS